MTSQSITESYATMDDADLFELSRQGDHGAFEVLVQRYDRQLFYFLRGHCDLSPEDAEDVVQEVWFKLHSKFDRYKEKNAFFGYLVALAKNEVRDRYRHDHRAKRDVSRNQPGEGDQHVSSEPDPVAQAQCHELVDDAMRKLSDFEFSVMHLRFCCGFTQQDTADLLNCTIDQVREAERRSSGIAQNALRQHGPPPD